MEKSLPYLDLLNVSAVNEIMNSIHGGNSFCLLLTYSIETLVYSNKIKKFGPLGSQQERTLIITNRNIYNFKKTCIPLSIHSILE
jgi:hypothetical protein